MPAQQGAAAGLQATPLHTAALGLGEGPRWIDGRLVLVDILGGALYESVHAAEPATESATEPARVLRPLLRTEGLTLGAVAAIHARPGRWLAAVGDGIAELTATTTGAAAIHWLHRPERESSLPMRMNDASVDPAGRFWASTMAVDAAEGRGSLYRMDRDGSLNRVLEGITIGNGPAFNGSGDVMYFADSARGILRRYGLDAAGNPLADAVFAGFDGSTGLTPDGMTVDAEDHLWLALWGSGQVRRYTPEGEHVLTVAVPASQSTAPAFGGERMSQLFITSARAGLPEPTTADGAVFMLDTPFIGRPPVAYRPAAAMGPNCAR